MKRGRGWRIAGRIALGLVGAGLVCVGVLAMIARRDGAELARQLRLARSEGIPTTREEAAAMAKSVPDALNAAIVYAGLQGIRRIGDPLGTTTEVDDDPSAANLRRAKAFLDSAQDMLAVLDRATKLKDAGWNDPANRALSPLQMEDLQWGADLLGLRGSIAAARGQTDAAIADARRIFIVAGHAGEQPGFMGMETEESVYDTGLRQLATWAVTYAQAPAYRQALAQALARAPRFQLRHAYNDDLIRMLEFLDRGDLAAIGAQSSGGPSFLARLWFRFFGQTAAKVQIVEGERRVWSAYDPRTPDREAAMLSARANLARVLQAVPVSEARRMEVADMMRRDDALTERNSADFEGIMRVVLKALDDRARSTSVVARGVIDPQTGTAALYRFDGRRLFIRQGDLYRQGHEWSFPIAPVRLREPPEEKSAMSLVRDRLSGAHEKK